MATKTETTYFERQNLHIIADKIFKVCDEDGARVETKIFFSIPFDSIIKPFEEKFGQLYKWKLGGPGQPPFPPVAMFKAIVYAKLNKNMSDCELDRELRRNPHLAAALGFDDVPDHQTISLFKRERLTVSLLNEIFNVLRDHLVHSGWIDFSSVTIDSAPLEAFVNLGKANKEIKLNDALACTLIEDSTYQSLAANVIVAMGYKKGGVGNMKKRIANLNHVLLYELGGFLSQAKVIKYLDKSEHAALLKSVSGGIKMPSEPTMSNFKKLLVSIVTCSAFETFRSYVTKYLAGVSTPRDTSVEMLFPGLFAALQTNYSYVDPDARLGYCATKKLVFLGYRVQLLIDDKKSYP